MSHNIVGSIVPLFNRQNTGKGRKARQTIGKQLASDRSGSQTIVKRRQTMVKRS
jgi:hypothetical protein